MLSLIFSPASVSQLVASGILRDHHGSNISITQGFLTTDSKLAGGVNLVSFAIAVSDGICPTNTSKLLRRWMDSHFDKQIDEVIGLVVNYAIK